MSAKRWIFLTFALLTLAAVSVLALEWRDDPYGVHHDPTGRQLCIYSFERRAKYFLSERYVPANFHALIIGPSNSDNLDVPVLAGLPTYNESISGANGVEEAFLVHQALQHGHYQLAVLVLFPILFKTHTMNDGLDTVRQSESLASIHMVANDLFAQAVQHGLHFSKSGAAPDGADVLELPRQLDAIPKKLAPIYDPIAIHKMQEMIRELQANGARIVYVIPPAYQPYYQVNEGVLHDWRRKAMTLLPPAPVIDFGTPNYLAFRSNPDNFIDNNHLEEPGAKFIASELQRLVPEALAASH